MIKKIYIQLFLISVLLIISLFIFLKYFKKSNFENNLIVNKEQDVTPGESLIEDLKYNAIISLKESDYILIKSKFAKYNTKNYDTLFNDSVSIDYGEHLLRSNFLDLSFKNSLVSIYDNVRYLSGISSLSADKAEIDILNKKTKIFMESPNNKVVINNKPEDGNN